MFGSKKTDVLMNGVSARATVMRIDDTGVSVNGNPRVKITLQVQAEGLAAPFEATKKLTMSRLAMWDNGAQIWVKYDPNDTSRVEIDQAKNDEMSAAAPAQPMPATMPGGSPLVGTTFTTTIPGGQTVIDARNVPGLRQELLKAVADMQAGGNPAELQEAIAKAMSQGQAMSVPPGTMIPGATGISPGSGMPTPAAPDPIEQLEKLNELRKSGALTQAEFDAQNAKILGET
jgi:hypothetical protein